MRKFTVTIYANSEYSVRERLQEIDHSISNIVWPSCNIDSSKTRTKKLQVALTKKSNTFLQTMSMTKKILLGVVAIQWSLLADGKWKLYQTKTMLTFKNRRSYETNNITKCQGSVSLTELRFSNCYRSVRTVCLFQYLLPE